MTDNPFEVLSYLELNVIRLHACFIRKNSFGEVSPDLHVTGEKKRGIMKGSRQAARWSHPRGCGDPPHRHSAPEQGCAACSLLRIAAAAARSNGGDEGLPVCSVLRWHPLPASRQGRGRMGEREILLFSFRRWDAGNQVQSFKSSKVKHLCLCLVLVNMVLLHPALSR